MKTTSLSLAALLLVGGLSVPALASDKTDDLATYAKLLQQKGYDVTAVYESSDNILRADVKLADGSTDFQYFYADTLSPVRAPAEANTRVLTKLDTRAVSNPVVTDSLLFEGDKDN